MLKADFDTEKLCPSVDQGFFGRAPKSQRFLRFAIAMPSQTPEIAAISETRESNAASRFEGAMESRYRFAISGCDF